MLADSYIPDYSPRMHRLVWDFLRQDSIVYIFLAFVIFGPVPGFSKFNPFDFYYITKTYLYNSDPIKPHFYIIKLGFTGVYIIFLISAQKHSLWVLVRTASPRRF